MPYLDLEAKKANARRYREENRERLNAASRSRYAALDGETKNRRQASNKKWWLRNKDKRRVSVKKWEVANKDKRAASVVTARYAAFGLTAADVDAIIKEQSGCAICHKAIARGERRTHLDHCHKTGKFRGVLCSSCNQRLGVIENEHWHYAAMQYTARADESSWIQTYTGRQFTPLNPKPEDVCIEDIAHHLAMKVRYTGAVSNYYSVAEHSVLVSRYVSPENALWALLHDAAEAYTADAVRPIKRHLRPWRTMEDAVQLCIAEKFGLSWPEPDEVKSADNRILLDEKAALFVNHAPREWDHIAGGPLGCEIRGLPWYVAEYEFIKRFNELVK